MQLLIRLSRHRSTFFAVVVARSCVLYIRSAFALRADSWLLTLALCATALNVAGQSFDDRPILRQHADWPAMATIYNASYPSQYASRELRPLSTSPEAAGGFLHAVQNGINGWSILISLLCGAILYDQCMGTSSLAPPGVKKTNETYSHVHLAEGLNCRACAQNTFHRSLPRISQPRLQ